MSIVLLSKRHDIMWATTWQNQQNECAPSEDSYQPGHPPSLIRVFALRSVGNKGPKVLHADSEDSDQTGRMPGWSESSLGAYSFCLFCHVVAHVSSVFRRHGARRLCDLYNPISINAVIYHGPFSVYPCICAKMSIARLCLHKQWFSCWCLHYCCLRQKSSFHTCINNDVRLSAFLQRRINARITNRRAWLTPNGYIRQTVQIVIQRMVPLFKRSISRQLT